MGVPRSVPTTSALTRAAATLATVFTMIGIAAMVR